ncbi:Hairy/enhancer-of-split with YRPW motif protein 2 [Entomophthora muscae]|uniref:Hairy/enhancer-of-split with YRPW motif protein 2 n=1 Tax=Entomophthora muscae TaxID=34485 RepID=A0ACC2RRM0_9FUNG|nr:Hairy/enhancer-of-split with YRPW motif protein 2 [Entomophthora muscae]
MLQLALWGNRADLSLINDLTAQSSIHEVSNLSVEALASQNSNILANDTVKAWNYLEAVKGKRKDIILDNSGFELFTDLLLADWLLQHNHASSIHFHGKAIPWFVSDTTQSDFHWVIDQCAAQIHPEMQSFGLRWKNYLNESKFVFSAHPFWTTPYPYWHLLDVAPDLYADLAKSSLTIFKGDLNYRKLVYDCDWPVDTSFSSAIGPLALDPKSNSASHFPPVLALRTVKSDPVVGLQGGIVQASKLDTIDKEWRLNGRYALIQFHYSTSK